MSRPNAKQLHVIPLSPSGRGERLAVTVGQFSDKGHKPLNQDFHGVRLPSREEEHSKGVALAIADGISSSEVSHIASETAVKSFLEDYFCTPDAWSVKQSGQRVLVATNAWLHAQTQRVPYRYDRDRGHVCTFSALVLNPPPRICSMSATRVSTGCATASWSRSPRSTGSGCRRNRAAWAAPWASTRTWKSTTAPCPCRSGIFSCC